MIAMADVSTINIEYSRSHDNSTAFHYEQTVDNRDDFTNTVSSTTNTVYVYEKSYFYQVSSTGIKLFDYSDEFHKMVAEESWVVTFLQTSSQLNNVKSLLPYYKKINQLMIKEEFQTCNVFLKNVTVSELSDTLLVGLLRLTYSRKNHLDAWVGLLKRSKDELSKRGHDEQALLNGLS
jgi:hypothetical protein